MAWIRGGAVAVNGGAARAIAEVDGARSKTGTTQQARCAGDAVDEAGKHAR